MPAETPLFVVFGDFEWAQKRTIFQKQIVATKMRSFFTFRTQIVFAYFSKNAISAKKHLLCSQPPKNTIFQSFSFFLIFASMLFIFSLFLSPTYKRQNKECTFFSENPLFDTLTNWPKNIFAPLHTICVFKITKKHYKIGEKTSKKKLGPRFDATLGQVLTQKNQILDQVLTLQHIYMAKTSSSAYKEA